MADTPRGALEQALCDAGWSKPDPAKDQWVHDLLPNLYVPFERAVELQRNREESFKREEREDERRARRGID